MVNEDDFPPLPAPVGPLGGSRDAASQPRNAEGPTASGLSTKIVAGIPRGKGTYWGEVITRNNYDVPHGFGIFKYNEDGCDEYHQGAIVYCEFVNGMRDGWGWTEYRPFGWRFGHHRENLKHGLGKQQYGMLPNTLNRDG
eukprot:GHVU01199436.1.p2 GENE.GHVU01199436.1~~GHVU01199436.1.p2  ORF type:complete len:140 (+),score=9.87 GHVU01199436.1:160-579(+)